MYFIWRAIYHFFSFIYEGLVEAGIVDPDWTHYKGSDESKSDK